MAPKKRPTDTDQSSMSRARRPCPILQVPATLHRCRVLVRWRSGAARSTRKSVSRAPHSRSPSRCGRFAGCESPMIKFGGLRFETGFDVSQAFTPCQLCERKTAKLVETGEVLDLMITTVARDTTPKHLPRQMIHHLRESVLAAVHGPPRNQTSRRGRKTSEKIQVDNARKRRFTEKY